MTKDGTGITEVGTVFVPVADQDRSPRHRQQRDHQHRPRPTIADDLRQRRPQDHALERRAT